jgi:hypothetical protein
MAANQYHFLPLEPDFKGTGSTRWLALLWGLLDALGPSHVPDAAPEPPWIRRWLEDFARGESDMALYYPKTS